MKTPDEPTQNAPRSDEPGARLERALEVFLAGPTDDPETASTLLQANADLRDLLEPMLEGTKGEHPVDDEAVLGDFRLLGELGRGGMGIVYAAWQRSLDRKVAVKVLAPALVVNPRAVARFRREAAAAGRLRHPNIVEVYGFGSSGDRHFFAMQLVEGESLQACTSRFREPTAAVALGVQLAGALAHAHAAGLVHRDVKPANILVQPDGSVALTDFGVASDDSLPSLTREGGFLGTLDYASPEQVRGQAVDARADIWALGVVLHELLAGEHPFRASTQEATMQRILTAERSLRGHPGVSDDLAAVVGRATEKEPARRYATAQALLNDLRSLQGGAAVSARLPTVPERIARWTRREPWRALAAAVLVIGVPLLAGSLGYLSANAPRIAAAKAAESARQREQMLATAWFHYHEDDGARALAALDAADPADAEVQATRAMIDMQLGDLTAATAALQDIPGSTAELLRAEIAAPHPPAVVAGSDTLDDFDCFVRAALLLDRASRDGSNDPEQLRQALTLSQRAVVLAEQSRLTYLITMANAAAALDDDDAVAAAERALARHFPDNRIARRVRARCLTRTAPQAALDLLDANRDAPLPGASLLRGLAHEQLRQLDQALVADREAVVEQPKSARAWTNLGMVLRKLEQYGESEDALRHATELAPRDVFAWNALGLTLRSGGKRDEARRAFEQATQLRGSYAPAAYNLGNLMMAAGDLPAAITAFQRAAAANPSDVRAVANLGDALQRAGRKQEALQQFVRAVSLAPNDLIPHYNLAQTALDLGLPELALPAARRAAALDKKSHYGSQALAAALLAQKHVDTAAALAAARTADERSQGDDPSMRMLLARALEASGDTAAAIELLDRTAKEARFAGSNKLIDLQHLLTELRATK